MTRKYSMALALAIGAASFAGAAQAAQEVRFTCAYDGNGCEILKDILARYESSIRTSRSSLTSCLTRRCWKACPCRLAGGSGPDFATVTDLGGLNRYYLDLTPYVDAKYWEDNFSNVLKWYRSGPDDKGIYGMHTQAHHHRRFHQPHPVRSGQCGRTRQGCNAGRLGEGC